MAEGGAIDRGAFATAFAEFMRTMVSEAVPTESAVRALIAAHLGEDPSNLPVLSDDVPVYDHVNLQLSLDEWTRRRGSGERSITAAGLAVGGAGRFMGVELADLVIQRSWGDPVDLGPVRFVEAPLPDGERMLCYESALLSVVDGNRRLIGLLTRASQHHAGTPPLTMQVMAVDREDAVRFLAELREIRHAVNVYRGRVLAVAQGDEGNPFGHELTLVLVDPPAHGRADVVLPDGVLDQIERQTLGFAQHLDRLRAAGRSLRRGLLLYGPPGTGKTHTVRYLAAAMPGCTTFVISGAAFGVLSPICVLARALAPSMIVLEDVDLVAHERMMAGPGQNPLLFALMNEMDGIGRDADVVFLLTTNRADLLEPALAARPGRVDLAVEIPLPDAGCRRRLITLYGQGMTLALSDVDAFVERTEGVSAVFIKELMRRAALVAAVRASATASEGDDQAALVIDDANLNTALHEMLESGGALTRALLGAGGAVHDDADPFG